MAELVYVDNSNVFIEGKRVKAVESGLAMNIYDAMNNRILDHRPVPLSARWSTPIKGKDEGLFLAHARPELASRRRRMDAGNPGLDHRRWSPLRFARE